VGGTVTGVGASEADKKIRRNHRNDMTMATTRRFCPLVLVHVCTQTTFISPIFPRKNGVVVEVSSFFKRKDTTTVKDFFFSFGDEREIKACKK
jgi:hypothetical protein